MFNNKLFKNTDKRKFFVSDELKILTANGSSVILVDTMEQEWRINTNEFFNFVLENKIKIENNMLKERIVIDSNMCMNLPKAFYDWSEIAMENEKIGKFELIPGNRYFLEDSTDLIYLDTKYVGEFKLTNDLDIKETKIYKKHLFVSTTGIEKVYPSNFCLKSDKNIPKFISTEKTDINVQEYIDLFKLISKIFYYSDIPLKEGTLEFKEISNEEILSITKNFNLYFDLFIDFYHKSYIGLRGYIDFNDENDRTKTLLDKNNSYFSLYKRKPDDTISRYELMVATNSCSRLEKRRYIVPKLN